MRALALLLVLAAVLVAAVLLTQRAEEGNAVEGVPAPGAQIKRGDGEREVAAASDAGIDGGTSRAAAQMTEVGTDAAAPPATEAVGPATRRLRGILTDGADGPALAGIALEVRRARERDAALASIVTDEDGRFETTPLPCDELFLRHVPDLEDPDRALLLWIRPTTFALPPSDDGEPYERDFWAQRPKDVVVVDVVRRDGSPAAGAFVQLPFTALDPDTGGRLSTGGAAETGSRGRAYVGLYDSAGFERGTLFARGADGTVSEVLALDASDYEGPHRLRLGAPCELIVRARWPEGEPAQGREVRLQGPRDFPRPGQPERLLGVTGEGGTCTFAGLYPAEYDASVENPRTLGRASGTVNLWPGELAELEIELDPGARELAASGVVLDEAGAPLAGVELVFRADGRWAESVVTEEDGRFECWAEPCELLHIALDALPHGDTFEPGARTVPFGARDIVFQRTARAASTRFRLLATDRATGAPLEQVYLTFDRGPEREEWSNSYAPRETYVVDASAETRCKIAAQGYVVRTVQLFAALEGAAGEPPLLEVALDRGLSHALRVLDVDTRAPIAGATFSAQGLPPVRSGVDGWVRLEADRWATYAVTCEGYDPTAWDPDDAVLFDHGPVFLSAE